MSASPGAVAAVARLVPATRSTRPRLSSGTRTGSRASSGEGCLGMSLHYHGLSLLWRTSGLVALQEGDEGKSCLTILSNTLFHSVTAVLGRG